MAKEKPETRFMNRVLAHVPKPTVLHPGEGVYRMKNHNQYIGGIPDNWLSGKAADLWVEVKWLATTPVRKVTDPSKLMTPLQVDWCNTRHAEGRNIAVLLGCPDGGVLLWQGDWNEELTAQQFRDMVQPVKSVAEALTKFCLGV